MERSPRRRTFSDWVGPSTTRHELAPAEGDARNPSIQATAIAIAIVTVLFFGVRIAFGGDGASLLLISLPAAVLVATLGAGRGRPTPVASNLISAGLLSFQLVLIEINRDLTHVGVAWFVFIPVWAGLTAGTRSMWGWTGITALAAAVVAVRADPNDELWNHPVTLPLVIVLLVVLATTVSALLWQTRRRVRELELAEQQARDGEAAARRDDEHKARLLTTMSHELRSPLMGVLASAEVLMSGPTVPANAANVSTLVRSANSLVQILDSVLDLAKLETGNLTVDHQRFPIRPMVESVASLFIDHASLDGTRLIVRIHPSVPSEWQGDETKVAQILTNLVANALRSTHRGEVVITAEPIRDKLRISVSDTGSGFSAEALESDFDWRATTGNDSSPWAESGFGLSISNDLAQALGSRIEVESVPGQGSRFWFESCTRVEGCLSVGAASDGPRSLGWVSLTSSSAAVLGRVEPWLRHWGFDISAGPVENSLATTVIDLDAGRPGDPATSAQQSASGLTKPAIDIRISDLVRAVDEAFGFFSEPAPGPAAEPIGTRGQEVAIVDDSSDVRDALAAMVESMGYSPLTFASGEDLMAWPGIGKVDVIFLDLTMPTLDGMQVLEQLRARPSTASIPVCILSGSDGRAERALDGGASTFLLKPVRLQTVREVLNELLGDRSPSTH